MRCLKVIVVVITLCSCQQEKAYSDKQNENSTNIIMNEYAKEIDKWKKELRINGEVGPPCCDDYIKWSEDNPDLYWGYPKEIYEKIYDINHDGASDIFVYFPAGQPCNGGNGEGSDFTALFYSNKKEVLSNKILTRQIENKIEEEFREKNKYYGGSVRAVFSIKRFDDNIVGDYVLWIEEDAHCCPSYNGYFSYNPFTRKISIEIFKHVKTG